MTLIKSFLTSNDAPPAGATVHRHWPDTGTVGIAAVLLLILVACQHQGSEIKPISAATPQQSTRPHGESSQPNADAADAQHPADEWQSCARSNAVCSATPVPAGAEVMDSAASQSSSVVPVRTESGASSQRHDASTRVRLHETTIAAAAPAELPTTANDNRNPSRHGQVLGEPTASPHAAAAPLIVATGITAQASYWYAWLALLVLLLLVWGWTRRRSQERIGPPPQAASATVAATASQAASADAHGRDPNAEVLLEQPHADAVPSAPLVTPSVPLQRLTFAPVGAIDDATDREIALPKQEQAFAARSRLQTVPASQQQPQAALTEAKRLLASARPEDALRVLESVLTLTEPPQEAWVVAGWAWWRLAHENEGATAYAYAGSAADAFAQALQREPARTDLMTRIARSHLLRAQHASGDAMRRENLDQALAYYLQRSQARLDEPADHLELAQAALQRANACEHEQAAERHQWLASAQQHLAAIPAAHPLLQDETTTALSIDVQLALAAAAKGEHRARGYRQAVDRLRSALAEADAASTDAWLAKLINATRSLIQHQSGGSRLLTLQSLKRDTSAYLQRTHAVAPLLAWINLLDEWARLLPARAAQAKLAEADQLFERASQMNSQGPSGIQFARAYYLRTRSQHEEGATSLRTLQQARDILENLPADALPASITQMETAEIELALARHAGDASAPAHYRRALTMANEAAVVGARPLMACHCAAQALLGLCEYVPLDRDQRNQLLGLASQLEDAGADQPGALRTAAEIRLATGEFASSSRLCEAAWNAGAARVDVLPLWQEADARWARTLEHANQDAGWVRLHQRLRLASTSS